MTWTTERSTMFTGLMDVYDEDGNIVAKDKTPENAHLIAAAPELLAACEFALTELNDMTTDTFGNGSDKEIRDLLKIVIAKAEGVNDGR